MQTKRRKGLIFAFAGVAIVLLFFLGKEGLRSIVKNQIETSLQALGDVRKDGLKVSIFPGKILFTKLKCSEFPVNLVSCSRSCNVVTDEIALKGINWLGLLFSKKLSARELSIVNPSIELFGSADTVQATGKTSNQKFHSIQIGRIKIQGGYFKNHENEKDSLPTVSLDTFSLKVDNFSWELNPKPALPGYRAGELTLHNFALSGKGLQEISFRKLHLTKKDSLAKIEKLVLRTKYGKKEFYPKVKYQFTWYNMQFPEITIRGLNFDSLMNGKVIARFMDADGWVGEGFVDYNAPLPANCYIAMPQEVFRATPVTFAFDSVSAGNGHIYFEAIEKGKNEIGVVEFKPFHVTLFNLTNDTQIIGQRPRLDIYTKGKFKGIWITQHFKLDLKSRHSAFSFEGTAENLPFAAFNSFLVPSMDMHFEGGMIKRVKGKVSANNYTAEGTLDVEYQHLDIAFVNEEKKKKKVWSEMVEMFFLKNDNLRTQDNFRQGIVAVKRDPCRSVFAFWWNAIRSGMLSSMLTDKSYNFVMRTNQPKTYLPSQRKGKVKEE